MSKPYYVFYVKMRLAFAKNCVFLLKRTIYPRESQLELCGLSLIQVQINSIVEWKTKDTYIHELIDCGYSIDSVYISDLQANRRFTDEQGIAENVGTITDQIQGTNCLLPESLNTHGHVYYMLLTQPIFSSRLSFDIRVLSII